MNDLRTAAQQALEALYEADTFHRNLPDQRTRRLAAMAALRAALAQQDEPAQEPYTGDVTRIMRDAGMTFHLGLPHKAVVEQMTRVVDLVYAEASIKAAQQFAAALAQQAEPVQEPAFHGFMSDDGTQVDVCFSPSAPRRDGTYATAYYTAPPHRVAQQAEPVQEPVDVGLLEYRGNSVAFIHQKMTAYRAGIDAAWDAFRAKGLHPDGKTPLANMIAKYTAPPQRRPLTEEEIDHAANSIITDDPVQWWRKLARAVERAHGIKE